MKKENVKETSCKWIKQKYNQVTNDDKKIFFDSV